MIAIEFEEMNALIGKDQDDVYLPLPAYYNEKEGSVAFCFQLNKEEIDEIVKTGKIWFKQLTFNGPLQPISLSTEKKEVIS